MLNPAALIFLAVFLSAMTMLCVMLGLADPLYLIKGDSSTHTSMRHGITATCFESQYSRVCLRPNDPMFNVERGNSFHLRWKLMLVFICLTASVSVSVIILACVDAFNKNLLWRGTAWVAFLVLLILQLIFAIFTATLPTLEFTEEQGNFNNLGTRDQSFWGQVLEKLSSGNTVFNTREAEVMHRDLSSDRLKIQLGWVIPVIWIGCAWALMALIMLALVPLYRAKPAKIEEKTRLLYQKEPHTNLLAEINKQEDTTEATIEKTGEKSAEGPAGGEDEDDTSTSSSREKVATIRAH